MKNKLKFIKLCKADIDNILKIQDNLLKKLEIIQKLSRSSRDFAFDWRLLTKKFREAINSDTNKILKKYNYFMENVDVEMVDYDGEGLIEFISNNLPHNSFLSDYFRLISEIGIVKKKLGIDAGKE